MGNAPTTGGDDVYTDAHGGLVSYHFVGAIGWPAAGPSSWPVGGGGDSRTTALTPFPATSSAPTAVAGVQSATITSTRATIGEAPTRYVVTASPGDATCTADVSGVCTITGLTAGTAYTFTSVAHNADPTPSGRSTASPSVTPTAPPRSPVRSGESSHSSHARIFIFIEVSDPGDRGQRGRPDHRARAHPGPGRVTVQSSMVRGVRAASYCASVSRKVAATLTLRCAPSVTTKRLLATRNLTITVRITFTGTSTAPVSKKVRVPLRRTQVNSSIVAVTG